MRVFNLSISGIINIFENFKYDEYDQYLLKYDPPTSPNVPAVSIPPNSVF